MFILTKISDLVQIKAGDLNKPSRQAIEDNINEKYSNKVIQKVGLCIALYDLLSASEGLIGHGTGIVNVNVEFRLIVFKPFKHEIIIGKISSATPSGIKIRTDFYDDIFVPKANLPENTFFDSTNDCFVVQQDDEAELYFDKHETVRVKIESEEWHDQSPVAPSRADEEAEERQSPYRLVGSMADPGTGPLLWWEAGEEEGEGEGEMEE